MDDDHHPIKGQYVLKIHCWRCLKYGYRASQCVLSNVSRGNKFEKSDRLQNCVEVETAFDNFGWKGWRNANPWMVARLTRPSAAYAGAPAYLSPRANIGLYLSKLANVPETRLWVTRTGETVKGCTEKKVTVSSIACFVLLWRCEHPECANPPPTTRRWAEAHGKPWAVKP